MRDMLRNALGSALAILLAACGPTPSIYAAAHGIRVFAATASGDAIPLRVIGGGGAPLVVDESGYVYAGTNFNTISVYAPGANGNVAPARVMQIHARSFRWLAVDHGHLYVPSADDNEVQVYLRSASGVVSPQWKISSSISEINGPGPIAVDPKRGLLYVAMSDGMVRVYPPLARDPVSPIRTIRDRQFGGRLFPNAIAVDNDGNLYVGQQVIIGDQVGQISVYAPDADGAPAPIRLIQGANTQLAQPDSIAVDPAGNLYVENTISGAITIYAPGASGNVAPIRVIAGPNTGLQGHLVAIAFGSQ